MKLHSPNRQSLVAHTHDFALIGFRRDFEAFGQRVALDHERMITSRRKWVGHSLEQFASVMPNGRGLAVHHAIIDHHIRAKRVANALMPETDAERGHPPGK